MRIGNNESGIKYLKKSAKYNSSDMETLNLLAEAYYNDKNLQESIKYYEK